MQTESKIEAKLEESPMYWFQIWLDRLSVCLAGLCLVHCLLTPVLLIALPIIGTTFFVHESFHIWMVFLVIPTTSLAIFLGCRKHKKYSTGVLSVIGMLLLVTALFFGHGHSQENESNDIHGHHEHDHGHQHSSEAVKTHAHSHSEFGAEAILTSLGGIFLASAHIKNYRLCRKAKCSH